MSQSSRHHRRPSSSSRRVIWFDTWATATQRFCRLATHAKYLREVRRRGGSRRRSTPTACSASARRRRRRRRRADLRAQRRAHPARRHDGRGVRRRRAGRRRDDPRRGRRPRRRGGAAHVGGGSGAPPRDEPGRLDGDRAPRRVSRRLGAAVADALASLRAAGAERVVLDLRGNGGGAFSAVLSVAGSLLPPAPAGAAPPLVALTREARGPAIRTLRRRRGPTTGRWRCGPTGRRRARARCSWARCKTTVERASWARGTYGKGVGQRLYGLPGGGALVATFERTLTPAGREIDGVGLAPDATRLFASSVLGDLALPVDAAFVGRRDARVHRAARALPAARRGGRGRAASACVAGRSSAAVAGGYGVAVGGAAWAGRRWRRT